MQFVLAIVASSASAVGASWASQGSLRSDVRDILTRMESQAKITELQAKQAEERARVTNDTINEMKRRLELVQLQYQELKESMLQSRVR